VDLDLAPMTVTCPRCRGTGDERFYGPCARCRDDLRATLGGVAKDVEVAAYEPKMNVVPNQIATKE
jgi:DnaJ-class molecular chaperone